MNLPCALLVVDGQGIIRLASHEAGWTLGMDPRDIQGHPIDDLFAPLDVLRENCRSHEEATISIKLPSGKPGRIGYTFSKTIVDIPPPMAGDDLFSIVFRDVTRESGLASERDRLLRLASLGAAAPTVIHEVKNSLAALTMGLELLASRSTENTTRVNLEALLGEARHVSQTLLGFGAVGRELKTVCPNDIGSMLIDARRVLRARTEREGVELLWLDASLPALHLDPAVLHAIVFNLVTNAINACSGGAWISVTAEIQAGKFVLSVEDTGRGMSPEVAERCTELFFSTRRDGNGIGLALCNEAILAAGGQLEIASHVGSGTRMTMRIPGVLPNRPNVGLTRTPGSSI